MLKIGKKRKTNKFSKVERYKKINIQKSVLLYANNYQKGKLKQFQLQLQQKNRIPIRLRKTNITIRRINMYKYIYINTYTHR